MFAGCAKEAKTFNKDGISVTLTDEFYEKDYVSANIYLESAKNIFIGIKESFSDLNSVGIYSTSTESQYAQVILNQNVLEEEILTNTQNDITLTYIVYQKTVSEKDFTYLAVFKKGAQYFYMLQFACETKNYSDTENQFLEWARTITVE
jgi:hypothetical protein